MNLKLMIRLREPYANWDLLQWPCSIRRDPKFLPQLYFFRVLPTNPQFNILTFSQAVANPETQNSVCIFDFLKRKFRVPTDPTESSTSNRRTYNYNRYVIDEREKKLYLLSGKALLPDVNVNLKVFDLHFDPPDKMGYRRITVEERPNTYFSVEGLDHPGSFMTLAFAINPIDGQLFTYHFAIEQGCSEKAACSPAALATPKQGHKSVVGRLSDTMFLTTSSDRELIPERFLFSRLDHLLVLFAQSRSGSLDPIDKPNKYIFVLAYNSEVELVHKVKIDPMDFVNKYYPRGVVAEFNACIPPRVRNKQAAFGCMFDLLGHIYKYVLVALLKGYILCLKWPNDWYALDELPSAQLSHLFYLPALDNTEQALAQRLPTYVVGSEIYVKLYLENNVEELHVVDVGPKLKDYRKCARCNKVEDKKRKNKQGQRIAKFKVCRKCKSLNLHLFHLDPKIMCHYCSDECQRLHWKIHKIIHKRRAIDREKSTAPTTYQKVL